MEFVDGNRKELFNDLLEIEFVPGTLDGKYKYKAFIPKDLWNKWRPDKPLKKKEFRKWKEFPRCGNPFRGVWRDVPDDWSGCARGPG